MLSPFRLSHRPISCRRYITQSSKRRVYSRTLSTLHYWCLVGVRSRYRPVAQSGWSETNSIVHCSARMEFFSYLQTHGCVLADGCNPTGNNKSGKLDEGSQKIRVSGQERPAGCGIPRLRYCLETQPSY